MPEPFSYRESGVDISREAEGISALVRALTFRRVGTVTMMGSVGHFAGLIDCGTHALALTVDGVGTKMLVADRMQEWGTIGIDCIAMNVNDLYVMNIEPVAFVDYIAAEEVSIPKMEQIGRGLNEGARQANIDIVGGETATLKGMVTGLDLAGACLGIQEKDRIITGEAIRPGDLILGVPSSGIHSNGLTLARRVVDAMDAWEKRLSNGRTLGQELLVPTRIYAEALRVCKTTAVSGMCHVTGGGLLNFSRLTKYGFSIDSPLPVPEVFRWIQENGGIDRDEMYRTFNMGMGYAFIAPEENLPEIVAEVPDAAVVGSITRDPGIRLNGIPFS
ncbi:MAG TPA: phosphoribosylformylglycinamidine cyclo-ligase [Methanoregulaceae archaeon]|nr:MAG: phosphoribosylformylglycinamidine cyclo-ligase [Methanolinea sp.]HON80767.1 phosphoribosylformylglycinamidine cyclo-ligase [Methanoregulaceae archaeon]HPD09502.1 phosphoribosylformylglycinamidine cyclo-ligase [Methanoregulaceae archaeon]HRT14706.1 phosphoribosylformylglycinamidine cyclo-ligase [Methanoregulaceae archaeon]HRU30279.1 phosphoribosylformylglycinamidine cyclo-ligase [Methanoregulaceae archaeon]